MKILMIGATGNFAKLIIPELKKKGVQITALVRKEERVEAALKNGADDTVIADLNNFESLQKAVQNVDGVFHLNPVFSENEVKMGLNIVKAAQEADVEKFVFSSVYHPSLSLKNHATKRPIEEALYEADMKFVILQPAMFMQTIGDIWSVIKKSKMVTLPYSKSAKMSYVDYRDVAEVTAIAFTEEKLDNGTFELCSPGTYDRFELVKIIGNTLKTDIEAKEISFEDFAKNTGMPDGFAKDGMKAMFRHYDEYGFHGGNSLVLETILGRKPISLKEFFNDLNKTN